MAVKKGLFFSMIAILMSALFVLMFSGSLHVALDENQATEAAKIAKLDELVNDLPIYVDSVAEKSGFEALRFLVYYYDGQYDLDNFNYSYLACIRNGTFDNFHEPMAEPYDVLPYSAVGWTYCDMTEGRTPIEKNISVPAQLNKLFFEASKLYNAKVNYTGLYVNFTQQDAYTLVINISLEVTVESEDNVIFVKPINRLREIFIKGMPDPLLMNTGYPRDIKFKEGVSGPLMRPEFFQGDLDLLREYIEDGLYFKDIEAPSFIDMLEGNWDKKSLFGINSFVPLWDDQTIPNSLYNRERSMLENQYYRDDIFPCQSLRRINYPTIDDDILISEHYLYGRFQVDTANTYKVCDENADPITYCCEESWIDDTNGFCYDTCAGPNWENE